MTDDELKSFISLARAGYQNKSNEVPGYHLLNGYDKAFNLNQNSILKGQQVDMQEFMRAMMGIKL